MAEELNAMLQVKDELVINSVCGIMTLEHFWKNMKNSSLNWILTFGLDVLHVRIYIMSKCWILTVKCDW